MAVNDYSDIHDSLLDKDSSSSGSLSPFTFLCVVVVLILFGLLMMYSASYPEAVMHGLPHYYYLVRQVIFAVGGILFAAVLNILPVKWIKYSSVPLLVISLVLMLLTLFSPYGVTVLGARRWLDLPLLPSFQPSELVKLSAILFLSWWFADKRFRTYIGWYYVVPLLIIIVFSLLIVAGKAYTTTILFLLTCLTLCIAGKLKLRYIFAFMAFLAVPGIYLLLSESYRVKRIASFLIPSLDPQGLNWQVNMSLSAISEGGFFGKGLGKGTYKLGLLPEVQNDFIFSSIAEECGFAGILFIFILFILLAVLGCRAARRLSGKDPFMSNMAMGITAMIIYQVIINVAVVTGVFPPTGIPLPFFSQGGTNLFIIIAECGLLYRAIRESAGGGSAL